MNRYLQENPREVIRTFRMADLAQIVTESGD